MTGLPSRARALVEWMVLGARKRGMTWDQIARRAEACGILPTVMACDGLVKNDQSCGRDEAFSSWRTKSLIEQMARAALWTRALGMLCEAADVPFIVLKGPNMGKRLLGQMQYRESHDLDIWVEPESRPCVEQALISKGYEIAYAPHEWASNQVLLCHRALLPIEIHWALTPPPLQSPSFARAYERSIICRTPYEHRILCDEDTWIMLILHAMDHIFAAKTLIDLAAWTEMFKTHETEMNRAAGRYGLRLISESIFASMQAIGKEEKPMIDGDYLWNIKVRVMGEVIRQVSGRMLCDGRNPVGKLVFGQDSRLETGLGVVLRALSMCAVDGHFASWRAALNVLLLGPHKMGGFIDRALKKSAKVK